MTIEQYLEKKRKLEKDISVLIDEFEADLEFRVSYVKFDPSTYEQLENGTSVFIKGCSIKVQVIL